MIKVKVIKRFNDVKVNPHKIREVDSTFEATEERAKYLVGQGMVEIVKETKKANEKEATEKKG